MTTSFGPAQQAREPQADALGQNVRDLLRDASIEVTPKAAAGVGAFSGLLPMGTRVYVTHVPGADFAESIATCRRLAGEGMRPVPHVAARAVPSRAKLDEWLDRLSAAGADGLLLIAGGATRAAGPYTSTEQVLETGLLERHGIRRIAVAGHPEGHSFVDREALDRALAFKAAYAAETGAEMWLVTQFVFEADPVTRWLEELHAASWCIPVRVGLSGPAKLRTVTAYALKCGIGASLRALGQARPAIGLFAGGWAPDRLLWELAAYRRRSANPLFGGVHIYPFGGFASSVRWLADMRESPAAGYGVSAAENPREAARQTPACGG